MKNTQSLSSPSMEPVFQAVQECRLKPLGDPQRIIILLAHPGFSLPSPVLQELRRKGAMAVQAGRLEFARVKFLKLLANRTRVVPLLLVSPEVWRGWNTRHPIESAQIHRRIFVVIRLDELASEDSEQPALKAA